MGPSQGFYLRRITRTHAHTQNQNSPWSNDSTGIRAHNASVAADKTGDALAPECPVTVFTTSFIWSYQTTLGSILPRHCVHHKLYMELPDYFRFYTARLYTTWFTYKWWSCHTTWLIGSPSVSPLPHRAYGLSRNVVWTSSLESQWTHSVIYYNQ